MATKRGLKFKIYEEPKTHGTESVQNDGEVCRFNKHDKKFYFCSQK